VITVLYAAILGIIFIGLTMYVVIGRYKYKIGLGDGGNAHMLRRIRMHANFAEFVPFALLLLFLTDYAQYSSMVIHSLGIMLVIGRVCHIIALNATQGVHVLRAVGVVLTLAVILTCSILLMYKFLILRTIPLE
jgi:uncharacterized protein